MNPKPLLAAVMCLGLFAHTGYAQLLGVTINLGEEMSRVSTKVLIRAIWNGSHVSGTGWINEPEIREAWNITDEQYQQIEAIRRDEVGEHRASPEYLQIEGEQNEAMRDPLMRNADERIRMDKFLEFTEKLSWIKQEYDSQAVDSILTAEQKQKIREFELANMANMTFFPVSAFEALDLTDDQRQQIEAIKKEFEPEFEKSLEDYTSGRHQEVGKKYHALQKKMGLENGKYHPAIHNKLMAEDPVYKRLHNEITAHKERFGAKFKVKMYNVLTDEQWARLQQLIDNPPEHAKAFLKKLKEQRGETEKKEAWMPGPNSWRPGDPIPEQYRQQRNERQGRFPRSESE
jgi:Spy/CpxP family protein refolding chaperone